MGEPVRIVLSPKQSVVRKLVWLTLKNLTPDWSILSCTISGDGEPDRVVPFAQPISPGATQTKATYVLTNDPAWAQGPSGPTVGQFIIDLMCLSNKDNKTTAHAVGSFPISSGDEQGGVKELDLIEK
jgi:hypothetical protein